MKNLWMVAGGMALALAAGCSTINVAIPPGGSTNAVGNVTIVIWQSVPKTVDTSLPIGDSAIAAAVNAAGR